MVISNRLKNVPLLLSMMAVVISCFLSHKLVGDADVAKIMYLVKANGMTSGKFIMLFKRQFTLGI